MGEDRGEEGETYARARAKIAAARETVAGVQERLAAAEHRLGDAEDASNPWQAIADALKDVPGARSIADALRGVDPGRIAATARRQARRMARNVRSSLNDITVDLNLEMSTDKRGEPILSVSREANSDVPPGGTLRVRNTLGDIDAVAAAAEDGAAVRVEGSLQVWAENQAAAESIAAQIQLSTEQGPEGPTIAVTHPARVRGVSLDLKVYVPAGVKVSLMSPSGDVTAQGVRGGVVLATQSGDALARDVSGDVAAETASGDIGVEGIIGNVTVSSASGDINAIRLAGQSLKASAQSGNVRVSEVTTPTVTVETVSGDVEARAVGGRSLRVRTVSGDVAATDIAASEETHLDTVSGNLHIAPRAPVTGTTAVSAVSGDTAVRLPADADLVLELDTKSGDIHGRWRGPDGERRINASGTTTFSESLGTGGGGRIEVSTVSGDIQVSQE